MTRDCVLEKKLIGLVEDFVVKDTVDCAVVLWRVLWRFSVDFKVILTVKKTSFLVDLNVLLLLCLLKIFTTFTCLHFCIWV